MKFFTVHQGPGDANAAGTAFVAEGFSSLAFFLPILWLPLKGLWVAFVILISVYVFIGVAESQGLLAPELSLALSLGLSLFVGLEARNWQRARLHKRGFIEVGTVAGANLLDAETRWFMARPGTLA